MSYRLSSLIRKIPQRSNLRYLNYQPTEGREKLPITEPQTIEAYYDYIYKRDFYPETYGNANEQHVGDPYLNSMLYDWDNYQYKYEGEWYDYGPITFYAIAFSLPFILGFFFYTHERYLKSIDGNHSSAGLLNRHSYSIKVMHI